VFDPWQRSTSPGLFKPAIFSGSANWYQFRRLDNQRIGLPRHLMDRLQMVINAAARLVFSARKYNNITPLLRELHWLSYQEQIAYRLAVLAIQCQHSLAPSYLLDEIHRAPDVDSRQWLLSALMAVLIVPRLKHSTIGDRAFPIAMAKV